MTCPPASLSWRERPHLSLCGLQWTSLLWHQAPWPHPSTQVVASWPHPSTQVVASWPHPGTQGEAGVRWLLPGQGVTLGSCRVRVVRGQEGEAWVELSSPRLSISRQPATFLGRGGRGMLLLLQGEGSREGHRLLYCTAEVPTLRSLAMLTVKNISSISNLHSLPLTVREELSSLPLTLREELSSLPTSLCLPVLPPAAREGGPIRQGLVIDVGEDSDTDLE